LAVDPEAIFILKRVADVPPFQSVNLNKLGGISLAP
jgi:hypothetical protein